MTTEQETLDGRIALAREALIEHAQYNRDFLAGMSRERIEEWVQDELHEIVDGCVPVYNADIMAVATDPRVWTQDSADFGQPRDLLQAAQWAIYQAITEGLNEDTAILDEIYSIANPTEED